MTLTDLRLELQSSGLTKFGHSGTRHVSGNNCTELLLPGNWPRMQHQMRDWPAWVQSTDTHRCMSGADDDNHHVC